MLFTNEVVCVQVRSDFEYHFHAVWTMVAPSQARLLAIFPPGRHRAVPTGSALWCASLPRDVARESTAHEPAYPVVSPPLLR